MENNQNYKEISMPILNNGSSCCGITSFADCCASPMSTNDEIKEVVKEKYGTIANKGGGCCGDSNSAIVGYTIMKDEYDNLPGYDPDADLDLGCGLPTQFAGINVGDTVVDLGSGAGNDIFVARAMAGEAGRLIGIDFTPEMIAKAEKNKNRQGFTNVEFHLGDIENIPLPDETADVIVSNCVLNLVPDKEKAFKEIYRITKTGGHFCVSDIVTKGFLPDRIRESAMMYAGCVAGAIQQKDYLDVIAKAGFVNIEIKKTKLITVPDDILETILTKGEISEMKAKGTGIFSITVTGSKL